MSNKIKEKDVKIRDFYAKSIEFHKKEDIPKGDLIPNMKCEYRWLPSQENNYHRIEAQISFSFEPEVLFSGKMVFEIELFTSDEISDSEKREVIKAIEARLGNTSSFVTTVCGEAICGMKFVVPPLFSKEEYTQGFESGFSEKEEE